MPKPTRLLTSTLIGALAAVAQAATDAPAVSGLSAAQIIERNVAARGGLASWHLVQTLSVSGKLDAGAGDSAQRSSAIAHQGVGSGATRAAAAAAARTATGAAKREVMLPFRLEFKRPHRTRLEVDFAGKTAVQVYDGEHGWKYRPYLNREDVEPFSPEEARSESAAPEFDGLLIDYAARGTKVALEGTEPVAGEKAYKLKLTLKDGEVRHVWVSTQTFLDVKVEGAPRRMDGKMRNVFVYQRDFRTVKDIKVPFEYDTAVEGYAGDHRMVVESVSVNPALEDARFTKAQVRVAPAASALAAAGAAPNKASTPAAR